MPNTFTMTPPGTGCGRTFGTDGRRVQSRRTAVCGSWRSRATHTTSRPLLLPSGCVRRPVLPTRPSAPRSRCPAAGSRSRWTRSGGRDRSAAGIGGWRCCLFARRYSLIASLARQRRAGTHVASGIRHRRHVHRLRPGGAGHAATPQEVSRFLKVASSPDVEHPARAVIAGFERLLAEAGVAAAGLGTILHATTVATNAIIERLTARLVEGCPTALLTTDGFRDDADHRRRGSGAEALSRPTHLYMTKSPSAGAPAAQSVPGQGTYEDQLRRGACAVAPDGRKPRVIVGANVDPHGAGAEPGTRDWAPSRSRVLLATRCSSYSQRPAMRHAQLPKTP